LSILINSYNESYVYYIGVFYWLKKEINSSDLKFALLSFADNKLYYI